MQSNVAEITVQLQKQEPVYRIPDSDMPEFKKFQEKYGIFYFSPANSCLLLNRLVFSFISPIWALTIASNRVDSWTKV